MTQIKKLGFGVIATALFAVLAMATVVNTTYAAITAGPTLAGDLTIDGDGTLSWTTDAGTSFLVEVTASSSATAEFENGNSSILVVDQGQYDDNAAANEFTIQVTPTSDGTLVVRVTDLNDEDATAIAAAEIGAPASALSNIALTGDSVVEVDEVINVRAVTTSDAGAFAQTNIDVNIGGSGTLYVAALGSPGDPCLAEAAVDGTSVAVNNCTVDTVVTSGTARADFAVEATGVVGDSINLLVVSGTTSATKTITIGTTTAATVTVTGDAVAAGSTGTFTVTALDASGNAIADGATPSVSASEGVAYGCSATVGGVSTCNFVAPDTAQTVTIVAAVGGATGTGSITVVGGTTPPDPGTGDGEFASAPNFGSGNVGSAVFNGGSIEQLSAAVTASGGTAVWVQGTDGNWYRYNTLATGATAFVNNAFIAQFAAGFSGPTAVFVVK